MRFLFAVTMFFLNSSVVLGDEPEVKFAALAVGAPGIANVTPVSSTNGSLSQIVYADWALMLDKEIQVFAAQSGDSGLLTSFEKRLWHDRLAFGSVFEINQTSFWSDPALKMPRKASRSGISAKYQFDG